MSRTLTASDRSRLIRLASTMEKGSEERKAILSGLEKTAYSGPASAKEFKLSGSQIEKDVRAARYHPPSHIDKYDFSKLLWNPVEAAGHNRKGIMTQKWFAYPYGDFGNKSSGDKWNYIYGYVEVTMKPTKDIGGTMEVNIVNYVKSY